MSSQEKTPQEKTPQKSPVEKTPHPILGLVEKTPHPILGLVEKTPQLYKKLSFWKFGILIHSHIENHIKHRRILLSHTFKITLKSHSTLILIYLYMIVLFTYYLQDLSIALHLCIRIQCPIA